MSLGECSPQAVVYETCANERWSVAFSPCLIHSVATDRASPGHRYADIVPADQEHGEWAFLVVNDYTGNETDTHEFHFEHGAPRVMQLILRQLATLCGPLMLISGTGVLLVVVTPDLDLDPALLVWDS